MPKRYDPAAGGAAVRVGYRVCCDGRPDTTLRAAETELSEIRFARAVAQFHRLGPRTLYQLLTELGAARMVRTEIEAMVERYVRRLDPDILRRLDGDRFRPPPLHLVGPDGG